MANAESTGWEQDEEVARRLLADMKQAEAKERAEREEERLYGAKVAEAHRRGLSVETSWEQDEEVYMRLRAEMDAIESVAALRTAQADEQPPTTAGGRPPLPPGRTAAPPAHDPAVHQRLTRELADMEERGHGAPRPPAQKWIPKGSSSLHHSASEAELLREQPWAQTTEVFQRLVDEMVRESTAPLCASF